MTAAAEPIASAALPPENVNAIAALSSLRAAYPYVAEVTAAEAYGYGVRNRRPIRVMSETARTRHDELLRAERDGRHHSARHGLKLSALRADERKRMADQLRDGLEHLDRDGTYGTLVSPGDVAQLIAAVEAGN